MGNQNLFASVKRIARNSRSPRTNQPQVSVLFLNSAMMVRERSGYDMANELRALQSDNVQIVMVNLGVPRRQRNIINNFQRFGPLSLSHRAVWCHKLTLRIVSLIPHV